MRIPASGLLFGAFLGVDPITTLPAAITSALTAEAANALESRTFLPNVLGLSFMQDLKTSLYISTVLVAIGAVLSALGGGDMSTTRRWKPMRQCRNDAQAAFGHKSDTAAINCNDRNATA